MRSRTLGGFLLLVAFFLCEAWSIEPFYKVGDTWRFSYSYDHVWMGIASKDSGWIRVEITSVEPRGDTLLYGFRRADSGVSRRGLDPVPTWTPYSKAGDGFFGYSRGNYFRSTGPGDSIGLDFFSRPFQGLNGFQAKYAEDSLELYKSDLSYDTYEYLEAWGPVHWLIRSAGGHTMNTWEGNLLEHNGRTFNRSELIILDPLHVGVNAPKRGKTGAERKSRSAFRRVFQGRSVDGRLRIME